MKQSMWRKALWYAILCGLSAAMPQIIGAIGACEAVSEIQWVEILDQNGIAFLTAALGGLGIGGAKAGWQNRAKPGQVTPVALVSPD